MFEHLKNYRIILVSGPQRSGTRIAAKMIAQDTGHRYIDERGYDTHHIGWWRRLVDEAENDVIQCPAMAHLLHTEGEREDMAVVWMRRDLDDIQASQERIRWQPADRAHELAKYGAEDGVIAQIKYDFWEEQKDAIKHAYEVEYESLRSHPLWVDKAQRRQFKWWQTEVEKIRTMRAFICTLKYRHLPQAVDSWHRALAFWQEVEPGVMFDHYLAYGDNDSVDRDDNVVRKYRRAQQIFLGGDWDIFITLEDDMIVPEDAFPRLMRVLQLGADIAYGLYILRHGSGRWSAFSSISPLGGQSYSLTPDFARVAWGKVRDVVGVGSGLTAYRRPVLVKLPFRRGGVASNDWYMADDAQKAGFVQRCDFGLICGHIGEGQIYWPDVDAPDLYRTDKQEEQVHGRNN